MRKKFISRSLCLLLAAMMVHFSLRAQFEEGKATSNVVPITGTALANNANCTLSYTNEGENSKTIKNIISFKIDEQATTFPRSGFTAVINLKIRTWTTLASSPVTLYKSITVTYDTTPGSKYKVRSYIVLDPSEMVEVTVNGAVNLSGYAGWNPLEVLKLENEMRILRYYDLSTNPAYLTPTAVVKTDMTDALNVQWTWGTGTHNNVSQLEWAWVEKEMLGFYSNGSTVDFNKLFHNNSTRVDLDYNQDNFKIPLLYDGDGKLYFRIRAGYRKNDGSLNVGTWSVPDSFAFSGHDSTLNWQSNTSYAEGGKYKSVIQYFDGTLRSRQTVTKDNSTGNTVVAETIYDLQGRANVQILPTPTIDNTIQYFKGFNRFVGQSSTADPARFFDLTPAAVKCNSAPQLDTFGNGKYYSGQNPWLGTENKSKFVPDAGGYAYTETRFTDDATQRVLSQSGVGAHHTINSGHETKYFYGKPSQPELDGLFGTEAGDASHYFKNMVLDANGQMSVSYVDMHGRTIATALAGDVPANLDSIKNDTTYYPAIGDTLTDSLVTTTTNILKGNTVESISSLLAPATTHFSFTYKLNPAIINLLACDSQHICFDCKYDLEISIKGEGCSDTTPVVKRYHNLQIVPSVNACDSSMGFIGYGISSPVKEINFDTTLAAGSYTVRKTLTLNDSIFTIRKDSALNAFLCKSEKEIYDSVYIKLLATSDCGQAPGSTKICDSCIANLGTSADYRLKYLIAIDTPSTEHSLDSMIYAQYIEDSLACVNACGTALNPEFSSLNIIRKQMLNDMMPFTGQYAESIDSITARYNGLSRLEAKYNIFTTSYAGTTGKPYYKSPVTETGAASSYFTEDGQTDIDIMPIIGTATVEQFASLAQQSWTNSLIYYHPEFAKLKFAETNLKSTYEWADNIMACETYAEAHTKGYDEPVTHDPYFVNNYVPADVSTITTYLTSHAGTGSYNPSIWTIANGTILCAEVDSLLKAGCISSKYNLGIESSATTEQKNQIWEQFRSVYLGYRNEMVVNYINSNTSGLTQANIDTLIAQGKQVYFATPADIANQGGWGEIYSITHTGSVTDTVGVGAAAQPIISSYTTDRCEAQRPYWKARLLQCDTLMALLDKDTLADSIIANNIINAILDSMVMVCHNSIDANNPSGASNVSPAFTSSYPQSFEQIINHVFASNGIATIANSGEFFCNPYSIDFPKPYGKNPQLTVNYSNSVDSCNCQRFAQLKHEALDSPYNPSSLISFNQFLQINYHDTITNGLWLLLQKCDSGRSCIYQVKDRMYGVGSRPALSPLSSCPGSGFLSIENNHTGGVFVQYETDTSYLSCKIKIYDTDSALITTEILDCSKDTITIYGLDTCQGYYFELIDSCASGLASIGRDSYFPSCMPCPPIPQINDVGYSSVYFAGETYTGIVVDYDYTYSNNWTSASIHAYNLQGELVDSVVFEPDFANCDFCGALEAYVFTNLDTCQQYKFVMNVYTPTCTSVSDTFLYHGCDSSCSIKKITSGNFVPIPSFLSCNYTKPCITCHELDSLIILFNSIYPFDVFIPNTGSSLSQSQIEENNLLGRFLNYRTGFIKPTSEYISFYKTCHGTSSPADSFLCNWDKAIFDPSDVINPDTVPCKVVQTQAQFIAHMLYEKQKDSLINRFDSIYKATCLNARYTEQFYVKYKPAEYHYTLYYYDQAGNLVKTLPPSAVKPNYTAGYLSSVRSARASGALHTNSNINSNLATEYKYNGFNQVIIQKSPDAGTSKFWYDRLGRLVVSQNAKQSAANAYSYTLYDPLGRIVEVGEKPKASSAVAMSQSISQDDAGLLSWLSTTTYAETKQQVTHTVYDTAYASIAATVGTMSGLYQKNLRNRVSYSFIKDRDTSSYVWNSATFYSYDIHGNVDTLLQDYATSMGSIACIEDAELKNNRFKKIAYYYDLVSGKVNDVQYQAGAPDQFYHRYKYDAENRITEAYTSRDKIYWEKDASYDYYRHGPLARTEIGQNQVQGIDYAYTVQGKLKGVNGTNSGLDMGTDGATVAKDAYAFSLHYFENDYTSIGKINGKNPFISFAMSPVSGVKTGAALYNGNIGAMEVDIAKFNRNLLYGYRYDQLNRITKMDAFTGVIDSPGVCTATLINDYRERIKYDPNGNILSYKRYGTTTNLPPGVTGGLNMDSLDYEYIPNTNKLKRVTDNVAYNSNYPGDIDNQTASENYVYDAIGNLVKDKAEGIDSITWTVYGKISRITKSNGMVIVYTYDASGNRISKSVTRADSTRQTYYVRDASGNVMSIYQYGYASINSSHLTQSEIHLYGSTRLGVYNTSTDVQKCFDNTDTITNFIRGNKFFELTNHLGNVLVTVSDKSVPVAIAPTYTITSYKSEVITASDYYPFGMLMPGRSYYIDTTTENVGGTGSSGGAEPSVTTIYKHTFNTSPYNHPYTISPDVLDANLNNTGWTSSKGSWTSFSDCATPTAGQSLAFTDTRPDTSTLTLTLSVDTGKTTSIRSFSFTHRSSATGYAHWKMYINDIEVGDSTLNPTSASGCTHTATGTRNVTHAVENITGTFTVILKLYGHVTTPTNASGTFRMNDFTLNGFTRDVVDSNGGSPQWANRRSYRYGFNGKENDNEVKGEGNQIAYEARMYDSRIGRLLSIDPLGKAYPWYTPFQFAGNDVIRCADLLGKQPESSTGDWNKGRKTAFLSGTTTYEIYDKSHNQLFEATGVYDPITGKTWIVAEDGQNQNKYFYLVNDDKSTDRIKSYVENGRRVLYGGHFERFETRNQIEAKLGGTIARAIGTAVFGMFAAGAAILAAPVAAPIAEGALGKATLAERLANMGVDYTSQVAGNFMSGKKDIKEAFVGNINLTSLTVSFFNPGSKLSKLAFNNTVSSFASGTIDEGYNGVGGGKSLGVAITQAAVGTIAGRFTRGTDLRVGQLAGRLKHINSIGGGNSALSTSLQSAIRNTTIIGATIGVVSGGSGNAINNKVEEKKP